MLSVMSKNNVKFDHFCPQLILLLAKFLVPIFKSLTNNEYTVKDSFICC